MAVLCANLLAIKIKTYCSLYGRYEKKYVYYSNPFDARCLSGKSVPVSAQEGLGSLQDQISVLDGNRRDGDAVVSDWLLSPLLTLSARRSSFLTISLYLYVLFRSFIITTVTIYSTSSCGNDGVVRALLLPISTSSILNTAPSSFDSCDSDSLFFH